MNENGEVMNLKVFTEAEGTFNNWIEEIQLKLDICNGDVEAYLESRKRCITMRNTLSHHGLVNVLEVIM